MASERTSAVAHVCGGRNRWTAGHVAANRTRVSLRGQTAQLPGPINEAISPSRSRSERDGGKET